MQPKVVSDETTSVNLRVNSNEVCPEVRVVVSHARACLHPDASSPETRPQVRVVEFNETTSFREQLETVSGSGVFISVHTSNLANSQFMRPGAAVFEIIQRNWAYHGLDKSFQV